MSEMTLFIDYSICIGCETCEAVCSFLHGRPRIHMTRILDGRMVPVYCRHCESPNCIKGCKRGALTKGADGGVFLDHMVCRGCETRQCILSCPYAAVFATDRGAQVTKCDLCQSRRPEGLEPACSAMCPCGAIHFVPVEELASLQTDEAVKAEEVVLNHLRPKTR